MKQDSFIEEHIGLVKKVASKYKNFGVPFDDLVQEGLLGLLEAKDKYIPGKNTKFSTYAVYWIKKKIIEFINKEKRNLVISLDTIEDIPTEIYEKEFEESEYIDLPENLINVEKEVLKLFFEEHKTLTEISELLNIGRERVRQIKQKALRKLRINRKLTDNLYSLSR